MPAAVTGERPAVGELIYAIFSACPDSNVRVGNLFSTTAAIEHIERSRRPE